MFIFLHDAIILFITLMLHTECLKLMYALFETLFLSNKIKQK